MQTLTVSEPVTQIADYLQVTPVMESMRSANDKRPNNTLPIDTQGTIQENAQNIPAVTLYNSHGILKKTNPNSLLGYA
jgi:hypothetical protein